MIDGQSDINNVRVNTPYAEFPRTLYKKADTPASQVDHPGNKIRIVHNAKQLAAALKAGWSKTQHVDVHEPEDPIESFVEDANDDEAAAAVAAEAAAFHEASADIASAAAATAAPAAPAKTTKKPAAKKAKK